jgi:1-acyl-sn-glycerol-3-phosphate acyltransferase
MSETFERARPAPASSGAGEDDARKTAPPVPAASLQEPTLRDYLVSAGLWALNLPFFVTAVPTLALACATLGPDRTLAWQRWYAGTQLKLTRSKWRAVVSPKVDPKRAYMFAHNHTNAFDFILMHNATPHYKQGLELESHFKIPVYGWFMKARGGIPVKPGKDGQTPEVMAHMRREVDAGHCILVFPEAHRTLDGRVRPFRKGTFFIARDLGLPVVPVTVTGAFDLMRKGSMMLRPGHELTVYVDDPIETAGLPDAAIPELAEHVHSIISGRVDAYWRERGWKG